MKPATLLLVLLLAASLIAAAQAAIPNLPVNPHTGDPASAADLDVTYIGRFPRYDYDADKNTPAAGDAVNFTAHIRNRGTAPVQDWNYTWWIDSQQVKTGTGPAIPAGTGATVDLPYTWQEGDHWVSFFADPKNVIIERSEQNNLQVDRTNALLVGLWVEKSVYSHFDRNQYPYTKSVGGTDEANSWEDWAQRQIDAWNTMLATAYYPSTPRGCRDRVRLDQVIVVEDGALPLVKGAGWLPTNHPDVRDRTVDMMWGFEADILPNGFYRTTGGLPNPFYIEGGVPHEMSHARYLVDSYGMNLVGSSFQVTDDRGARMYPFNGNLIHRYSQGPSHMEQQENLTYSEWEAAAFDLMAGQRALPGWANYNAHGGLGFYLASRMPKENVLRVVNNSGSPVQDAIIQVYQAGVQNPPLDKYYPKSIDNTPDINGRTDAGGEFSLGSNPFSVPEPIGAWDFPRCVDFIKIRVNGQVSTAWLDLAEVQTEYFRGNTGHAVYTMTVPVVPVRGLEVTSDIPTYYARLGYSAATLRQGQTLRVTDTGISRISVALARKGTPGNITLSVRSSPTGAVLATATITPAQVTSADYRAPTWVTVPLTVQDLTPGSTVSVILAVPGSNSRNYYTLSLNAANTYPDGAWLQDTAATAHATSDLLVKVQFTDGTGAPLPTPTPGPTESPTPPPTVTPTPTPTPVPCGVVETTGTSTATTYLGYSSVYYRQAQSLKAAGTGISQVSVALAKKGTPARPIQVHVRSALTGTDLASGIITPSQVTSTEAANPTWVTVPLTGSQATTRGSTLYVVLEMDGYSYQNYYLVPLNGNNPYPDGAHWKNSAGTLNAGSDMPVRAWFTV